MKLPLLALSAATSTLVGTEAFVLKVPQQPKSSSTTTALNNYRTKWSPRPSSVATCPGHAAATTYSPPSPISTPSSPLTVVTYNAIRAELKLLMNNPSWDDGSLAPIFIRLAWHSSGTFDAASGTGGSNGAGMRFENEAADPENAGLSVARAFLEPVKRQFPEISYSDLWILAAYVGLENTGGPVLEFQPGRIDHLDDTYFANNMSYGRLPAAEKYCCPHLDDSNVSSSLDASGKVEGWEGLCTHVRNEVFYRMGFNDQEIVALLCGGHVYGRCHPNASGYAGPWVDNMTEFSNEYAADMIEDEWRLVGHGDTWLDDQGSAELRPAPGNRQFVNQSPGMEEDLPNQMMLLSDMILAWDPAFRAHLEVYAEDEARLKWDFGVAFKKLTELGCGF
mmetsp:Transcript_36975/g.66520  ORF Transcript_36975/g.66520 Transcript_36975/m.66520 type:complete len:393 (-) Transcript_36975:93-1271(-)|eukprot:CAMPEP_0201943890 /NCGR_PEP_ID=MMETSP0903-20130614/52054_1 /ASSEMBLY_ACC=CAM_ASM_000552 /TAXON_ID=420261 /ORGANISM="Thalassiosira antarctica, Strain CCMP982" /LENGTH=392 /DNA_ID=CAMNT_0048486735 /DNA_START=24 /DNA_END=1202 /DNA_ORIENTATION=+